MKHIESFVRKVFIQNKGSTKQFKIAQFALKVNFQSAQKYLKIFNFWSIEREKKNENQFNWVDGSLASCNICTKYFNLTQLAREPST